MERTLRYWSKVLMLPIEAGGHWLWTGALTHAGYGQISIGGKARYAHRLALDLWEMDGRQANHVCAIRRCVAPHHLYQGSQSQNLLDASLASRLKHRRSPKGIANGKAVHSFATVRAARRMRQEGATVREIGARLGINEQTVRQWISRRCRVAA